MQNLPWYNNGLSINNKDLINWWDYKVNFDKAIQQKTKLYKCLYGDFNNDSLVNGKHTTILINAIFGIDEKIFMDLSDHNIVNLQNLVEYLKNK